MERGAHRRFSGPDAVTEAPLTRPGSWDAALGQSYVAPDAVGPLGVLVILGPLGILGLSGSMAGVPGPPGRA